MENASKALIIAGAILLAIIIISLGLMVVNNARNQIGGQNLNKQEIESFNAQWESFVGKNKTTAQVRSMFSAVIASNAAETKNGTNRYVTITNAATATTTASTTQPTASAPTLSNSSTYDVVAGYSAEGLIVNLAYTVHSNTTQTQNPNP